MEEPHNFQLAAFHVDV